jgi:hypothetical protein
VGRDVNPPGGARHGARDASTSIDFSQTTGRRTTMPLDESRFAPTTSRRARSGARPGGSASSAPRRADDVLIGQPGQDDFATSSSRGSRRRRRRRTGSSSCEAPFGTQSIRARISTGTAGSLGRAVERADIEAFAVEMRSGGARDAEFGTEHTGRAALAEAQRRAEALENRLRK